MGGGRSPAGGGFGEENKPCHTSFFRWQPAEVTQEREVNALAPAAEISFCLALVAPNLVAKKNLFYALSEVLMQTQSRAWASPSSCRLLRLVPLSRSRLALSTGIPVPSVWEMKPKGRSTVGSFTSHGYLGGVGGVLVSCTYLHVSTCN